MRIAHARNFAHNRTHRPWGKLTSVNLSSFSVLMTVLTTPLAAKSRTSMASFLVPTAVLAMVAPLKMSFAGKALPMGTGSPSGMPTLGGKYISYSFRCGTKKGARGREHTIRLSHQSEACLLLERRLCYSQYILMQSSQSAFATDGPKIVVLIQECNRSRLTQSRRSPLIRPPSSQLPRR